MIKFDIFINVYYFGKFNNPADKRYYPGASVRCDRCNKNNLDICISWDKYDLCLKCISDINSIVKDNKDLKV